MTAAVTEADRIRISDDVVGVTSGLVAAMLRSKMVSREGLPGIVKDIHSAIIDISLQSISLADGLQQGPDAPAQEPHRATPDSIRQAVSRLMAISTTEAETAAPHTARVSPPSSRPASPTAPAAVPPAAPVVARAPSPAATRPPSPPRAQTPPFTAKAPSPAPKQATPARSSSQGTLPFGATGAAVPDKPWTGEERRARPVKAKTRPIMETVLPPRLSSIEQALTMDNIVCLEDGKKVKDLGEHLAKLNISPDDYRRKWKLPAEYPMMAPSAIMKRAEVYEIDLVTGKIRKSK
jgi:Predicted transcriptional regulator